MGVAICSHWRSSLLACCVMATPAVPALQSLAVLFDEADVDRCGRIDAADALRLTKQICQDNCGEEEGYDAEAMPPFDGYSHISFTALIETLNELPWFDALPMACQPDVRKRANQFTALSDTAQFSSPVRSVARSPFKKKGQGKRAIVNAYRNDGGRRRSGSVQILLYSIPHMLEQATQKLGLSRCARKAYDMRGTEVTNHRIVANGQDLVISSGEPFVVRKHAIEDQMPTDWRTETNTGEKPPAEPCKEPSVLSLTQMHNRCITLFPNDGGISYDHHTAVAPSRNVLLQLASRKLGLPWKARRMFQPDGTELYNPSWSDDEAEDMWDTIKTGDAVVFSCGEDFKQRKAQVIHERFGKLSFSVDRLDMDPGSRNAAMPIISEGYQHTRTAPFCRQHKPDISKAKGIAGFHCSSLVPKDKKQSGLPPAVSGYREIADRAPNPGSPVKERLSCYRHAEEEAGPADEMELPWAEEMGQLEALSGHYQSLLHRQRTRSQLENYVRPELLRGDFLFEPEDVQYKRTPSSLDGSTEEV